MNSSSLYTDDKEEIPIFNKHYKYFLNKSIVLYGASNSGKSMIMRDILYILKDYIPNICVICPTNNLNKSYNEIIPPQLIFADVTEELIKSIFQRQKQAVKLFNLTNDINNLKKIFYKIPNKEHKDLLRLKKIIDIYEEVKNKLNENNVMHISEKKIKLQKLNEEHTKTIINYYKQIIHKNKDIIDTSQFNELEKNMINYININPNFLIIIDDAAYNANIWCKYPEIKELFFNGRHHKITFMISFQDDKLLDSGLRKNAFVNIFTTQIVCNTFFERSANNFTKKEKTKLAKMANLIFSKNEKSKTPNYKKLVYIKDENPSVYYTIADYYDNFLFGSKYLHKLCNKIKKNNSTTDDWNEFKFLF